MSEFDSRSIGIQFCFKLSKCTNSVELVVIYGNVQHLSCSNSLKFPTKANKVIKRIILCYKQKFGLKAKYWVFLRLYEMPLFQVSHIPSTGRDQSRRKKYQQKEQELSGNLNSLPPARVKTTRTEPKPQPVPPARVKIGVY